MAGRLTFFLRSERGELLALARLLQDEGHAVQLYTEAPEASDVGRGLVERARSKIPPSGAVVVFDGNGHDVEITRLRASGHRVIGGNGSHMTPARWFGRLERLQIPIPEWRTYRTIGDALEYLRRRADRIAMRMVLRLEGDTADRFTQCAEAGELVRFLEWLRRSPLAPNTSGVTLHEHLEGVPVWTVGWYDGARFVWPFVGAFVERRFLDGELGPRTQCQASAVWGYDEETPAIAAKVLRPLEAAGVTKGYVGPLAVESVVTKDGTPHVVDVVARLQFDTFQAFTALLWENEAGDKDDVDVGAQLARFAAGELEAFDIAPDVVAGTLRVSIPPYPLLEHERRARAVRGFPVDRVVGVDPYTYALDDVMQEGQHIGCAGRDGNVLAAVHTGEDLGDVVGELVAIAEELELADKQHRRCVLAEASDWLRRLRIAGMIEAAAGDVAGDHQDEDLEGEDLDDGDADDQPDDPEEPPVMEN